jgi:Zn-dependent oligopeptidase
LPILERLYSETARASETNSRFDFVEMPSIILRNICDDCGRELH